MTITAFVQKWGKAALEGALGEQGRAPREHEGALREQQGSTGAVQGRSKWEPEMASLVSA